MRLRLHTTVFTIFIAIFSVGCFDDIVLPDELEDDVVTIRFWHAMAGELNDALNVLIDRFHDEHPDIRVIPIYQGSYGSLSQKIIGSVIANEPPDVSQVYPAWVSFLNQDPDNPAILPLDDFATNDPEFDQDDFFEAILDDCRLDGHLVSMPFNKSFPVLYYNRAMLAKAGFDQAPATWDDFARVARACTKDTTGDGRIDQWGWVYNNDAWIFSCAVLQWGGKLVAEDGLSAPFDSPEAIGALRFFFEAVFGDDPFAYIVTGYDHQTDFVDQRAAMVITSSVSRVFMKNQLRFEYGMAPLPKHQRRAAILSGTNVSIFSGIPRERQEAAWKFLRFFSSPAATAYWSMRTSYVPVRQSALDIMRDFLDQDPNSWAAINQLDVAFYEPSVPAWYECRQLLRNAVQRVLTERTGLEERLRDASVEMSRRLRISAQQRGSDA